MSEHDGGVGGGAELGEGAPNASVKAPSAPDPLLGRTINGRFTIVSLIARGGMGKVYKAEQAPLGRICALKVLSPSYEGDGDPEFHRRFFLEAATAAKLTHPNTITIFDYGKADDEELYYIAMEYVEGRTVYRVLREDGPLPEPRVSHVARQICRSLREAHRAGVVHRDLKPANVLLSNHEDERDNVKVLDFGLVKDVSGANKEDLTQAGLFMGSPKYMAPEQITGAPVTACTDVYALGVVMFEMLCGRVPFDRGKSLMTLMAHVNDPVPALSDVLPGLVVSPQMESIVYRCLEKDPARRFASMDELLTSLKQIDAGPWKTQTSEGLPAPEASYYPASTRPSAMPSVTPGGPASGPAHSPSLTQVSASRSVSDPAPAPLADTGAMARPPRASRWSVMVGLAVASTLGLSAFVMLSRRGAPRTGEEGAAIAAVSAPAPATAAATAPSASAVEDPAGKPRAVLVESDPAGATVSDEKGRIICGPTPCSVTWKDGEKLKLQIDKQGWKTAQVTVAAGEAKVTPKLEPAKATPAVLAQPAKPAQPAAAKPGKVDDFKPSPY